MTEAVGTFATSVNFYQTANFVLTAVRTLNPT